MKKSIFTLLLGALFLGLSTQNLQATNPISEEAMSMTSDILDASDLQKETLVGKFFKKVKKRVHKTVAKAKATYYKVAGMFSDPVRKWMWFWLIFGLLGVLLIGSSIVAGIGTGSVALFRVLAYIGYASSLFSSVSFVIWIIKLIQG